MFQQLQIDVVTHIESVKSYLAQHAAELAYYYTQQMGPDATAVGSA